MIDDDDDDNVPWLLERKKIGEKKCNEGLREFLSNFSLEEFQLDIKESATRWAVTGLGRWGWNFSAI